VTSHVTLSVDASLAPAQAFETLVDELTSALEARGMRFDARLGGGIREGDYEVGSVAEWRPGERISLVWRARSWEDGDPSTMTVTVAAGAEGRGSRVTVQSQDWGSVLGDEGEELLGWFAGEVVAPLISATAPQRFGDWVTDRRARRPSGARSRGVYRDPTFHWPNFFAILDVLSLSPDDRLLDVGCGGGAFLHEVLKSGCRAAGVDHSAEMVRVATEANREAVEEGRLEVREAEAGSLPFPDGVFSCAVMTGVVGFVPDPLVAFGEVLRVLGPGGRFLVFTGTEALRGTPAAPEPIASRLRFYEDGELVELAKGAGFGEAVVDHPSLYEHAKRAGVPEAGMGFFTGTSGSQLLVARKA
jgi:SAM-dependent methyltransferase